MRARGYTGDLKTAELKSWKLTIEYDGTKYSGWQEQRNARTVQGQLRKAAEDFLGGEVDIQGSGRTDAGVHARAQVAHLRVRPAKGSTRRNWPPSDEILRAINSRLPSDVCLLDVADAPNTFHARHDAIARTYMYQISTRRTAFFKKYVWWVREPLDTAAMSRAARMLVGRYDFRAFRAEDPSRPDESTHCGGGRRGDRSGWRSDHLSNYGLALLVADGAENRRRAGAVGARGNHRSRSRGASKRPNKSGYGCCGLDRPSVGAVPGTRDLSGIAAIRERAACLGQPAAWLERRLRPSR